MGRADFVISPRYNLLPSRVSFFYMRVNFMWGKVSEVVVKALSVISNDNVEMKHSPIITRPKDQSAAALLGALDLPGCYVDGLCSNPEKFRFFQIVDVCV